MNEVSSAFGMDIVGIDASETHVEIIKNRMPREGVDPEQTFSCGKRSCNIGKELALHELESARWKID